MAKTIVCIHGGPSSGKSGTALSLTGAIKDRGIFSEVSQEEYKNWVMEGRVFQPGDQSTIFEIQAKKERHLMFQGVEVIVTDSPLMLGIMYGRLNDQYEREFKTCELLLKKHHKVAKDHGYRIEHYFMIRRPENFEGHGRHHDLGQSQDLDKKCIELMNELGVSFIKVHSASEILADLIIKKLI